jgi:hypothetical protein
VVAGGVVLVAAVGAGVVAAAGRDGDGSTQTGGRGSGTTASTVASTVATAATTVPVAAPGADVAFAQAATRLREAGSFRYGGAVTAYDVSDVRPSLWLGVDLTVDGQVVTAGDRVHEVAVAAATGRATETVAAGDRVWGRSAPRADGLAATAYELIPGLSGAGTGGPAARGAALLPAWLAATTAPTAAGTDAAGRPVYRALIPAAALGPVERGRAPVDAVVTLSLDAAGAPAHVDITAPAGGDPRLHLALDVTGLGDPVAIDPPG